MSHSRRILIIGSLALLALSMAYGLWYALAMEHQRLDQIGGSLAGSFLQAADRNLDGAQKKLQEYGDARYRYTREVDAHSHWTGLALLLLLLGAAFDQLAFAERMRIWLAWLLLISATGFPACVLWQNLHHGTLPRIASAIFAGVLLVAMSLVAGGFIRRKPQAANV